MINKLDIKIIEMLKEQLDKTKAYLDMNLTMIDLGKKEDGYNCYAIVYKDSNILDSYEVTKEFITGYKHA